MPIGQGSINGKEINWYAINSAITIKALDIDMTLALNQTLDAMRTRELEPYSIMTFNSLAELIRTKEIRTDELVRIDQSVLDMIRVQTPEVDGDIAFDQAATVDLTPAMLIDHILAFAQHCEIDHVFFSRWVFGGRMYVHAEQRGMRVEADNRRIIVPREREVLVRQKKNKVVA